MITLLITGLSIMGVSNAILIGFLGGMLNVIPYLGPIIGASIGTVLAIIAVLSAGTFTGIGWVAITVIGVFLAANLVDNILLQPLIYSNSVKAHPIEIFLVIIMAGSLAGIPGMVLAIPSYTVLRILAKEFLGNVRIVQKLTDKM
jgi:predicted PurR-regulated permease PerM